MCMRSICLLLLAVLPAAAQVIEFESGGLRYQTLTRSGITIMWAELPAHVGHYKIMQVAVSNGSLLTWTIKPEDFSYRTKDGVVIPATPARSVVGGFIEKGGRNDVIHLVSAYEQGIYGMKRFRSTNGYEMRRQAALAEVSSARLKSAAAASAIVMVQTKLSSGQSTDGAVFFMGTSGKSIGAGKLTVRAAGETFEFDSPE
jgi:hypothetical protein